MATQMKNELMEDMSENMRSRFESGMTFEEYENECDEFIQYHYNTHPMTKYECVAIVGNNLQAYLEMEEEVNTYWLELTGEEYNKSGLENIIPLWRLAVAEEWKNENLESLYEELHQDPLTIQQ